LAKADTAFQAHPLLNRLNLAWPCPREEALVEEEEAQQHIVPARELLRARP
jgi:hypothetical protein